MKLVSLTSTLPNQSVTFTEDSDFYEVVPKSVNNFMTVDISRNGVALVTGLRCVTSGPLPNFLLPLYKEAGRGNFAYWNDSENYPLYSDFGVTTFLAYYSPSDLVTVRS